MKRIIFFFPNLRTKNRMKNLRRILRMILRNV
jgi:hypothetical protein